jgi:hypothetical protein
LGCKQRRRWRAPRGDPWFAEVLERLATAAAREALATLALGSGPVGADAAASVERLQKRR